MNRVKEIQRINQRELEMGGNGATGSWHDEYKGDLLSRAVTAVLLTDVFFLSQTQHTSISVGYQMVSRKATLLPYVRSTSGYS